jgi:hypothetical protein
MRISLNDALGQLVNWTSLASAWNCEVFGSCTHLSFATANFAPHRVVAMKMP